MECWEPSERLLIDTGKPRKTCVELAGRRTFRIRIWNKTVYFEVTNLTNVRIQWGRRTADLRRNFNQLYPDYTIQLNPTKGCLVSRFSEVHTIITALLYRTSVVAIPLRHVLEGLGFESRRQIGRNVKLTTHLHLMTMLRLSGDTLLSPPYAFMARTWTLTLTLFSHCKAGDSGLLPVCQATRRHAPEHHYIDTVRLEQLNFYYHRAISLHTPHEIDKMSLNYTTIQRTPHYLRLE